MNLPWFAGRRNLPVNSLFCRALSLELFQEMNGAEPAVPVGLEPARHGETRRAILWILSEQAMCIRAFGALTCRIRERIIGPAPIGRR